jgi:flagellar biosynthetic protein FliP
MWHKPVIRKALYVILALLLLALLMLPTLGHAQGIPLVSVSGGKAGQQYSMSLQLLGLMTTLTLLPSMLLMMTSFVRIIIVLSILRQALGTAQTPPNTVLVGLALFLTFFIMSPVFEQVYKEAIGPYMNSNLDFDKALIKAEVPVRDFMTKQTREDDIAMFMQIANRGELQSSAQVPFTTLMPAFITSEIKSAFTIGFLIYIPFVVIDLIVASVLMAMGMMMLSPMIISMPIKLMLFVLIDGWTLLMASLANSFVFEGVSMDTASVVDLARQALWMTMIISGPLLGVGLIVGLVVGIFQAATSINEQTLSFIPKILAVGLTMSIAGGWMINTMVDYTKGIFIRIPSLFM